MQNNKKEKDLGQLLGWVVFALVIAGTPLLNIFQQATGIPVPGYALPALIGMAVVLNVAFSLLRTLNSRSSSDTRLPNSSPASSRPAAPVRPMPPFTEQPFMPPVVLPTTRSSLPASTTPRLPSPLVQHNMPTVPAIQRPRFDPLISPAAVGAGVIGLLVLLGLGLVLF